MHRYFFVSVHMWVCVCVCVFRMYQINYIAPSPSSHKSKTTENIPTETFAPSCYDSPRSYRFLLCVNASSSLVSFFLDSVCALLFLKATKICSFATFFTYSCGIYIFNTDGKIFFSFTKRQWHYYSKILLPCRSERAEMQSEQTR